MNRFHWVVSILFSCSVSTSAMAVNKVTLTLPAFSDNGQSYFHELLVESLKAQGVQLNIVTPSRHTPQKRAVHMLNKNQLSMYWLVKTPERNAKYHIIDVPLTEGMIGQRVLLIPKGAQARYDDISTLEEFRKLGFVAGLGANWYDIDVWNANKLPYHVKDGEWRQLYEMLSVDGGVNYFPRGMHEVVAEAEAQHQLDIEESLILKYDRSMVFYMSELSLEHQLLIERALNHAKDSGLMQRLIDKHWKNTLKIIKPEGRTIIDLTSP
ncbi:hypothetical protein [Vibrio penaeicida]|uniref:Transporter substrate-binding domain-containing protein n=1 Tax=Vibrio penaeicida TaxID=104609 RepID=A0AAV5NXY4_9VIBR|nr:hypothetical protein [Vibrio penaeicida]RTZ24647.1 hypothetical protein EKN09_02455 [Vibrio penaeicida]GLQ75561.1 hypothetical protein GCM10007932_49230 [Vibrio penaeicida]